jgi:TatD DNase family protein|tara:strand:+ start:610 stop:1290 length:681 start_codon:yes stop_codon:yes gene_type:complete
MEKAGVKKVITNGLNPQDNKAVLELSKKYKIVEAALGIYPTEAGNLSDKELKEILNQIKNNKNNIIAIGEVGLDHHWTKDKKKQARQKEVLREIIKLANKIKKPIIVHSRNAEAETVEVMKAAKVPVIMHCFCGKLEPTEEAIKAGFYFSIPTMIVRSKTFKKLVKRAGLNKLLTETDAPFLAPKSGERNDASNITQSITKIAEVLGKTEKEVTQKIYSNYKKLFT